MRWSPQTTPAAPEVAASAFGVSAFRSLLPQGVPVARSATGNAADCFFTLSNTGVGTSSNRLFRIKGTLSGQAISCLVDCGATHDFVSQSFVAKHRLMDQLLPSTRRVRGYDGTVAETAGTLVSPLLLDCPALADGKLPNSTPRRAFVVAQLHTDDVILGMPWLAELDVDLNFAAQRVRIPLLEKGKVELPLLPMAGSAAPSASKAAIGPQAALIANVMQLYADPAQTKHERAAQERALHDMLSRPADDDVHERLSRTVGGGSDGSIAQLAAAHDDRGRKEILTPDAPELERMRDKLLKEFSDVFADSLPAGLPPGRGHELQIQLTPGARTPARVPPRINQKHAAFESKWLKDMLDKKLISKSQSQFASPHFYVEKQETQTTGKYRAVTDFRALNAVTVKNKYPLPRADQLFDKLVKAKYFTKIDLRTGFYQILINAADRYKTAFTTTQGLFEYNVLPMGLCNSPGIFMQLMNDTFAEFLNKSVLVFLDDIIVYSDTLEEHEQHV